MKKEKETSGKFELSIKRLEEIVGQLETGGVSLDDAMKLYEEGVNISRECVEKLSQAELKLKKLSKDANGNFGLFDSREA